MSLLINREIEFRGIPLFGKVFVYGSLIIDTNEKGEKVYIIRRIESGKVSNFEVKEETVGQLVLINNNEQKIYEGDVFIKEVLMYEDGKNSSYGTYWIPCKCVIIFKDVKFCGKYEFEKLDIKSNYIDMSLFSNRKGFVDIDINSIEVIGNIHENPELKG